MGNVHRVKQLKFWSLPRVLLLQLKRFKYTMVERRRVDVGVQYPLEGLDLGPYCVSPPASAEHGLYDLVAVSKHIGGLGGGHYAAFARSSIDGEWYCYDDHMVRRVSPDEVRKDIVGAYILAYIR